MAPTITEFEQVVQTFSLRPEEYVRSTRLREWAKGRVPGYSSQNSFVGKSEQKRRLYTAPADASPLHLICCPDFGEVLRLLSSGDSPQSVRA
jgi:hypothetical protein